MDPHYLALVPAYISAVILWFVIYKTIKRPWDRVSEKSFKKPWLEFLFAVIAVIFILGIGQLYIQEMLIPNNGNNYVDALNQIIIFSPALLLLVIRKQSLNTIWLPTSNIPLRLLWGLILAFIALFIYSLIREDSAGFTSMVANTYHPKNISHFVQVFLENVTIALLFVRLSEWIGVKWSIAIVAVLFAAGHIPSMMSDGASMNELLSLIMDAGLGILVLSAVSKSRDIWWFIMVHFALDMSQFYGGII